MVAKRKRDAEPGAGLLRSLVDDIRSERREKKKRKKKDKKKFETVWILTLVVSRCRALRVLARARPRYSTLRCPRRKKKKDKKKRKRSSSSSSSSSGD